MFSTSSHKDNSKDINKLKKEICPEIKSHILYNLKKSHKRLDELISDLDALTLEH